MKTRYGAGPRYIQTPNGTLRSGVTVRANGHTGSVVSIDRTRTGRVVIGIEWDDAEVGAAAQRAGIAFITRPHLEHHRDAEALEILDA